MFRILTHDDANNSIHLKDRPKLEMISINQELLDTMSMIQDIVSGGLSLRAQYKIRARQPLQTITLSVLPWADQMLQELVCEELNIKTIVFDTWLHNAAKMIVKPFAQILWKKYGHNVQKIISEWKLWNMTIVDDRAHVAGYILEPHEFEIAYATDSQDMYVSRWVVCRIDMTLTPDLIVEGFARDIIRHIQELRKEAWYQINDHITLSIVWANKNIDIYNTMIEQETLSTIGEILSPDISRKISIDNNDINILLQR